METEAKEPTALQKVETGLAAFETRKAELTTLAQEASKLTITDLNDKGQYKAVQEMRKRLKNERVPIEKTGKQLRDLIQPVVKRITSMEKELVGIIEIEEDRLHKQEKDFEAHQEKLKKEAEEREQQRIQARIDAFMKYGLAIDYVEVLGMTDAEYETKLEAARTAFEAEEKRKADEAAAEQERKRKEAEALAKQKEEQEKEAARLAEERKKQQEEFEKFQKEKAEYEAKKKEEEDRIAKANAEAAAKVAAAQKQMIDSRSAQLQALGLRYDGEHYHGYLVSVPNLDITTMDDNTWSALITSIEPIIEQGKKQEAIEAEHKAALEAGKKRCEILTGYDYKTEHDSEEAFIQYLAGLSEADWFNLQHQAKNDFEKQQEAERKKAEKAAAAKLEALKPEKEKAIEYINRVFEEMQNFDTDEYENKTIDDAVNEFCNSVERAKFQAINRINSAK